MINWFERRKLKRIRHKFLLAFDFVQWFIKGDSIVDWAEEIRKSQEEAGEFLRRVAKEKTRAREKAGKLQRSKASERVPSKDRKVPPGPDTA